MIHLPPVYLRTALLSVRCLFFFIVMRIFEHHVFYFHQPDLRGAFILVQLHGDVFDICLCLRDDDMFQGVDTAAGLLDLGGHKLARFLDLSEPSHLRQDVSQGFDRVVQITGCKCKAIGIDVVFISRSGLVLEYRNIHTHDILFVCL